MLGALGTPVKNPLHGVALRLVQPPVIELQTGDGVSEVYGRHLGVDRPGRYVSFQEVDGLVLHSQAPSWKNKLNVIIGIVSVMEIRAELQQHR